MARPRRTWLLGILLAACAPGSTAPPPAEPSPPTPTATNEPPTNQAQESTQTTQPSPLTTSVPAPTAAAPAPSATAAPAPPATTRSTTIVDPPTSGPATTPVPAAPTPTASAGNEVRIEHAGQRYMPVSLESLRASSEPPGRVTFDARFVRELPCAPCPPNAKCQPCAARSLFEETAGDRESRFGLFVGGLKRDTVYRLYLKLSPGYAGALGSTPPSDPRIRSVVVEGVEPLR